MKTLLFSLLFSSLLMAQDFGLSGTLYAITTKEVPIFTPPDKVEAATISYIKFKSGEGVYLCPFLKTQTFTSMIAVAGAAINHGREVFISTVRTDYQGRALSASRYGKEMQKCANSISFYKI